MTGLHEYLHRPATDQARHRGPGRFQHRRGLDQFDDVTQCDRVLGGNQIWNIGMDVFPTVRGQDPSRTFLLGRE